MAWELQQHMTSWIAPSIWKEARAIYSRAHRWWYVAQLWANQRWVDGEGPTYAELRTQALDRIRRDGYVSVCHEIADWAIEHVSSTTNGGWEVYLTEGGWDSVPWCSEDERLAWYS